MLTGSGILSTLSLKHSRGCVNPLSNVPGLDITSDSMAHLTFNTDILFLTAIVAPWTSFGTIHRSSRSPWQRGLQLEVTTFGSQTSTLTTTRLEVTKRPAFPPLKLTPTSTANINYRFLFGSLSSHDAKGPCGEPHLKMRLPRSPAGQDGS